MQFKITEQNITCMDGNWSVVVTYNRITNGAETEVTAEFKKSFSDKHKAVKFFDKNSRWTDIDEIRTALGALKVTDSSSEPAEYCWQAAVEYTGINGTLTFTKKFKFSDNNRIAATEWLRQRLTEDVKQLSELLRKMDSETLFARLQHYPYVIIPWKQNYRWFNLEPDRFYEFKWGIGMAAEDQEKLLQPVLDWGKNFSYGDFKYHFHNVDPDKVAIVDYKSYKIVFLQLKVCKDGETLLPIWVPVWKIAMSGWFPQRFMIHRVDYKAEDLADHIDQKLAGKHIGDYPHAANFQVGFYGLAMNMPEWFRQKYYAAKKEKQ